ncbi:MAG: AbrB/MazE/SpoVT family DNA-binding domain-containing protein [Terracidiphilus sp.]
MQVSKWGNSLAVRLPAAVVQALELKEGDEIEISIKDSRRFEVERDSRRLEALEMIRELRRPLPPGYKFNRAELYDREVLKSTETVGA